MTASFPPRRMNLPKSDRPYWYIENPPNHDLLYLAWGERRFGEAPMPCTRHDGWVYAVIEHGSPVFVTPNARRPLKPGTAIIVGPDHAYGWQDSGSRKCRMVLWMWRRPSTHLLPAAKPNYFRALPVEDVVLTRLQFIHCVCREEVQTADHATPAALMGLHQLLDATIIRNGVDLQRSDRTSIRMELAARWIESHLESRQPAARLADYLGVSLSTLHRLFKRQFECSPDQYIHNLRMEIASRLLRQGDAVKAVAYKLGYGHPGDLSRAFKRHFKVTPEILVQSKIGFAPLKG